MDSNPRFPVKKATLTRQPRLTAAAFRFLLDRRRTQSGIAHTAKCLIAEGRLLGDDELRQIQELGPSAVVMRRKEFAERCRANQRSDGKTQPVVESNLTISL
jgi:hypothetical protein